jgi:guanine deaminase
VYYACTAQDAAQAGFDDQFIYEQFRLPIEGRQLRMIRVSIPESTRPFEAWQAKPDKKEY